MAGAWDEAKEADIPIDVEADGGVWTELEQRPGWHLRWTKAAGWTAVENPISDTAVNTLADGISLIQRSPRLSPEERIINSILQSP